MLKMPVFEGEKILLELNIDHQPDDVTCGPTCLHAVYNYFGEGVGLTTVIQEVSKVSSGGTLAVMLGNHAMDKGYHAMIYTYNLHVFDPTWFQKETDLIEKLQKQVVLKQFDAKLVEATKGYLQFLEKGGKIVFKDLFPDLIKSILSEGTPILTGLNATYLYESAREIGVHQIIYDDIAGEAVGHFVVINGYDEARGLVSVADPLGSNPMNNKHYYKVPSQKLINAILLGVMTYDANLLVLSKPDHG